MGVMTGLTANISAGTLVEDSYILMVETTGDAQKEDSTMSYVCYLPKESNGNRACVASAQDNSSRGAWLYEQDTVFSIELDFPEEFPSKLDVQLLLANQDLVGSIQVENIEYEVMQPNGAECDGDRFRGANVTGELESP